MKARLRPLALETLEDRTLMSTCHVTRLADTDQGNGFRGTLRYCINKVNTEPGPDVIDFGVTGTINLNGGLPGLLSDIDIQGPGADILTVRRSTTNSFGIFAVGGGATVMISNLSIANGSASLQGGGISNDGLLTIEGVRVTDNFAGNVSVAGQGGGIYNGASLSIRSSTITENSVSQALGTTPARGGGIFNAGFLTITDSTIESNAALGHHDPATGGGVYNTGVAVIYGTTISNNVCSADDDNYVDGAGIYNSGRMKIRNSTIAGNQNRGSNFGELARGGGIFNKGTVGISYSTIASNTALGEGGGIYRESGTVGLRNTVVGNNFASADDDISGAIVSAGHNLISNTDGGSGYSPSDILDVNPMLGPLADNGGATPTMALLPGSPAIDAGDNADAPKVDQRGPGFPRIVNGTIDIGAFEVQATGAPRMTNNLALLITADFDEPMTRDTYR